LNHRVVLTCQAPEGHPFVVECSEDLLHWRPETVTLRRIGWNQCEVSLDSPPPSGAFFRLRHARP
jgi:hypothetical protein